MKYVCAACEREFKLHKNEVYVLEKASFGPYRLWLGDLWKCAGCGAELIAGFAHKPVAEHYESHFHDTLDKVRKRRPVYVVYEV